MADPVRLVAERTASSIRGTSPQTAPLPAGAAAGDLVYLFVFTRGGTAAACPTPAGWTLIPGAPWTTAGAASGSDQAIFGFRRIYDGAWAMPAVSWTGDGTNAALIVAQAYSGVDAVTPEDAAPVATTGLGLLIRATPRPRASPATLTAIVTVTPNAYVAHVFGFNAGTTTFTPPDVVDVQNINRPTAALAHSGPQAVAGSSGSRSYAWTGGAANGWVGVMLALRPTAGPPPIQLAATLQGVATSSADLRARRGLAASVQGVGSLAADLGARRGLAAALQGVASLVADLGIGSIHGPEDYETALGPLVSLTMLRRASLYVTVGEFPVTVLPDGSVMKASLYSGRGASAPPAASLYRQTDTATRTVRLDSWSGSGPTPPAGNFPAGEPATLATEDGSPLLRSYGMPRSKAQNNAVQSIPNDTQTTAIFAAQVADPEDMYDPATSLWVIPYGGQWLLTARIAFAVGSSTGYRQAIVQRSTDGGTVWAATAVQARVGAAPGVGTDVILSGVLDVAGGTMIRVVVRHTDGAALNLAQTSYVALIYLGPT